MKTRPAMTIVEIVLVIGLIAVFIAPFVVSISGFRSRHALKSSGENLANSFRTAKVYAREERDEMAWGIRFVNSKSYSIISGQPASFTINSTYLLDTPVEFADSFSDIWFLQSRGETDKDYTVTLVIPGGVTGEVRISKAGIVKYVGP
jgi:type II secretory pathway pseudopilin PulG